MRVLCCTLEFVLSDLRSNSRDQQEKFTEMKNKERELHDLLTSPAVSEPANGQDHSDWKNKRTRTLVQHAGMASSKKVNSVMEELAPNSTDLQLGFNREESSEEESYSPRDTINSREEFVGSNSKSKAQDLQEERRKIVFDSIRNDQEKTHRKNRIARQKATLEKQQQNHLLWEVREKRQHERFDSRRLEKMQEEKLARKKIEKDKIIARGIIKEKCASKRNSSSQNKLVNSRQRPQYVLSKEPGRHMHDKNTKAVKHLICRCPTLIRKSVVGEKELGIINKIALEREIEILQELVAQKELKLQCEAAEKETMRAQIAVTAQAAALAVLKIQEEHRQRLERLKPLPTLNY